MAGSRTGLNRQNINEPTPMIKKILLIGLAVVLGVIALNAPAPALFGYVNNHRKFNEWNPWLKMDPAAKNTYSGPDAGVGAIAEWEGKAVGKGRATITESRPGEFIKQRMAGWNRWKA
jgi:hypothetical protein